MNVLLVEDEPTLLEALKKGLTLSFPTFKIEGVESAEAGEALIAEGFEPRLVISDIRLPGKDGVDLLIELQDRLPDAQFILISGFAPPETMAKLDHQRVLRFLHKPFELQDLISEVQGTFVKDQFSGTHKRITFIDVLQMLNMAKRTAKVLVTGKEGSVAGEIFVVGGDVHHAHLGNKIGEEAFRAIFQHDDGTFKVKADERPPRRTIEKPFDFLLMDAMADESGEVDELAETDKVATPAFLDDICRELVEEIPEAVGAGVLDLASWEMVTCHHRMDVDSDGLQLIAKAVPLVFQGSDTIRHATLGDDSLAGFERPPEVQLRLGPYCHCLLRISRDVAVWLVLEGAIGEGWKVLRSAVPKMRPMLGLDDD